MKKIGLFYSFRSNKTAKVAEKIVKEFNDGDVEIIDIEITTEDIFISFDNYILGVPTWFDGELPNYWDEFLPTIEELDLTDKIIAIYGLGDQKGYPENFGDAIGIMASLLEKRGATVVGFTSIKGYKFENSQAVRGDQFCGLVLDQENQGRLTNQRVTEWVTEIKGYFR
ncbi:flavodoxin [Puteibacter caeruleilacunae]|nr:flavodoxin [Puteibacter caeruleilacunae]